MNVVYGCDWTEYSALAEPKYDGVTYALSEFLLMREIERRGIAGSPTTRGVGGGYEYSRPSQPHKVIVSTELAGRIYKAGGIITFKEEPAGVFGLFNPHDPKANIETYRRAGQELSTDELAHSAEMTGTS